MYSSKILCESVVAWGSCRCALEDMVRWSHIVTHPSLSFLVQSRLSVNSVTAGDYARPLHISTFINELDSGFRLLNLKNDSLRKRYDGLKYDVKKVEEVVYDLSIRGFNKETAAACAEK